MSSRSLLPGFAAVIVCWQVSACAESADPQASDQPPEPSSTLSEQPKRGLLDETATPIVILPAETEATEQEEPWQVPLAAFRRALQPVAYPNPPEHAASRQVTAQSMQAIQAAAVSNTVITVSGTLTATEDDLVTIGPNVHDLTIRFQPDAEIRYVGGKTWSGIFRIDPTAQRIRFESPRLIGPRDTFDTCAGFELVYGESPVVAQDIAITDATLVGLNYAIQAHNGCRRMAVQNCVARDLIDYFFYGAKRIEDVTIQGCTAHGVKSNHVIRIFDAERVNIFRNDLKVDSIQDGQMKRTIWILTGRQVTIAANRTHDGRITIGPNPVAGDSGPDDRIGHVNIVRNRITHTHTNTPIELLSGAHDVFLHGNVIDTFTDAWLGIGGWNEHRRPISHIRWTNGTVLNGKEVTGREGVEINERYAGQSDIGVVAGDPELK